MDFSLAPQPENPGHDTYGNTTWFYLYSLTPVHDPTQYRPLPEFHQIDSNNEQWNLGFRPDGSIQTPLVGTASGGLVFHPDRDRFAVLGWRSPYTGKITVELQLRFADPVVQAPSNGIVWSIDRGATSLQGALLTPGNQASGSMTVDINAGDTIYVVIDNNGDSNYDTTVGSFRVRTVFQ